MNGNQHELKASPLVPYVITGSWGNIIEERTGLARIHPKKLKPVTFFKYVKAPGIFIVESFDGDKRYSLTRGPEGINVEIGAYNMESGLYVVGGEFVTLNTTHSRLQLLRNMYLTINDPRDGFGANEPVGIPNEMRLGLSLA